MERRLQFIARLLLLIYLLGGIFALTFSLVMKAHREAFAFSFFGGAVISLLLARKYIILPIEFKPILLRKPGLKTTGSIFYLFLTMSTIIFLIDQPKYTLSVTYFIVVGICITIIVVQILFLLEDASKGQYFVLFEIFFLALMVSCSFVLLFPGFNGNDAAYHVGFIDSILKNGNVNSWFAQYENYPIYQILFVQVMSVSGLSIRSSQLVLALIQIIFLIFPYLLMKRFFGSRVGLLAALFLSMAPNLFEARYTFFPMVFSAIFIMFVLFLLLYPSEKSPEIILCLIFGLIAIALTHPLTSALLIVVLLISVIVQKILKIRSMRWAGSICLLMIVTTLTMWMRPISGGTGLFSFFVEYFKGALFSVDVGGIAKATTSQYHNWIDIIMNDLGLSILMMFGILGAFIILKGKITERRKEGLINEFSVVLACITLVIIPVPFVLTIIFPDSLPNRWFPLVEILASMTSAFAILHVLKITTSKRKVRFGLVAIVSLILILMITSPVANPNATLYSSSLSIKPAATLVDISGAQFINQQHWKMVGSSSRYSGAISIYDTWYGPNTMIDPTDPSSYSNMSIIIQNYDLIHGFRIPLFGAGQLLKDVYPDEAFFLYLFNSNNIYNSGESRIYS